MVIKKALLSVSVGVSLCLANISGIVTDSGATPIAGAVVRLEKGGLPATTGSDGRFTLVTNSAILPENCKLLQNGLPAKISGNVMTLTLAAQTVVEVSTFDLGGKTLSTMRTTLPAGSHSITMPYKGTGMYLYKVKLGHRDFLLKKNAAGLGLSGNGLLSSGSPSNHLAQQALGKAAMGDVIAVTKTGYLNYRCVQTNFDTTGLQVTLIVCADSVRDIDGNVYQAVRIGNQVWMTENLRVTNYTNGSAIPRVSDSAAWNRIEDSLLATPAFCFYNNTTDSESIRKSGALYNWYVINPANPKKIIPAGWHIPTDADWLTLQNYLITRGYNWDFSKTANKIAKALAAKTDWNTYTTPGTIGSDLTRNNRSGFAAVGCGYRSPNGAFVRSDTSCIWWRAEESGASLASTFGLHYNRDYSRNDLDLKSCGFSIRLVRNLF